VKIRVNVVHCKCITEFKEYILSFNLVLQHPSLYLYVPILFYPFVSNNIYSLRPDHLFKPLKKTLDTTTIFKVYECKSILTIDILYLNYIHHKIIWKRIFLEFNFKHPSFSFYFSLFIKQHISYIFQTSLFNPLNILKCIVKSEIVFLII